MVASAGRCNVGGVVSTTSTVNVSLFDRPRASVAMHVTVDWPIPNSEPLAGKQNTGTTLPWSSAAVTSNVATAPDGPIASSFTSVGAWMVGGCGPHAVAVTVVRHVATAPRLSVTVRTTSVAGWSYGPGGACAVETIVPSGSYDPPSTFASA